MSDFSSLSAVQDTGIPWNPVSSTGSINLPVNSQQADQAPDPVSLFDLHQQFTSQEPIQFNAPTAVRSYQNKYNFTGNYRPLADVIPNLPAPLRNTVIAMDQKRVQQGQNVIPAEDTLAAINTVLQGRPVTPIDKPNPIKDLPNAAFRDAKSILTSLPLLPVNLVKEVSKIGDWQSEYAKAQATHPNTLSALAASPGIRLLPGSFVAEKVLSGQPSELLRHPVMAALDVAPYVSEAAEALKGTEAYTNLADRVANSPLTEQVKTSRLYQGVQSAVGAPGRDTSHVVATYLNQLADMIDPSQPAQERWITADNYTRGLEKTEIAEFNKQAQRFKETYDVIPEARRAELSRAYQLGRPEDIQSLGPISDLESSFIQDVRDLDARMSSFAKNQTLSDQVVEVPNVDQTTQSEIYDKAHGTRILNARADIERRQSLAPLRDLYASHPQTVLDTDQIETLRSSLNQIPNLKRSEARTVADTVAETLQHAGYGDAMKHAVTQSFQTKGFPLAPMFDTFENIVTQTPGEAPVLSDAKLAARQRRLDKLSDYSPKAIRKAQRLSATLERKILPARFQPLMDRLTRDNLHAIAVDMNSPDSVLQAIEERNYNPLVESGVAPGDIRKAQRDATKMVMDIRREGGADPIFLHRTSPDMAHLINFPTLRAHIVTPSQVKARTLDMTPHYDDFLVAIPAQGVEWASRVIAEEMANTIADMWGKNQADLAAQYQGAARALNRRNPSLDVQSHTSTLINKAWTKFDPSAVFPFAKGKFTGFPKEDIYIPKAVSKTLEHFFATEQNLFTTATAPIMNAFRTSVLPLSPRWHVYNILGGAVMMMARTNPFTVWQHLGQAVEMARHPELVEGLLRGEMGKSTLYQAELSTARGVALGEMIGNQVERLPGGSQLRAGYQSVIERSYKFNQFVDDMYRAMSYLYGQENAINKGMSAEQAIKAGVDLSRRIMPDWASMTPFERNTMRAVLPFYGFMSHVLRYVYQYPFDHPIRASIVSNFAKAELQDYGEQTPTNFLGMFELPGWLGGGKDEKGAAKYLNTAGWNPFNGAADIFTVAGFLGQTNPVISAALQSVGIDPRSGEANLYPDVKYDRETGRLALQNKNPLANLFAASLPQVSFLQQLVTPTSDLNRLRSADPEIADRIMRSALGFPNLVKRENLSEQQMRGELARREAIRRQTAAAVKAGQYTSDNPVGQAYLNQLQGVLERQPEALTKYTSQGVRQQIQAPQTQGQQQIGLAQNLESILLGGVGVGQ